MGGGELVVSRGDVIQGFAEADRIFEGTFRTQVHAPAGMETRAALAAWEGDELTVWKTSRAVHANDREALSRVLGIAEARIRVVCTHMGGGFGNKDETRLPVLTALLAKRTGRPVRLEYSRAEEFIAGRNRQSSVNHLRIGVMDWRDGEWAAKVCRDAQYHERWCLCVNRYARHAPYRTRAAVSIYVSARSL